MFGKGKNVRRLKDRVKLLLIVGWSLCLPACANVSAFLDMGQDVPEIEPLVFRSEDYTVIRIHKSETAEDLAERFLKDRNKAWVIEDANRGVPFSRGSFIVIPHRKEGKGGLRSEGYQKVPVLCYHQLAQRCESALCVTSSLFEEQMRYLKRNGYRVISLAELADFLAYRQPLPNNAVIINLDDGYRSTYEIAYPILRKYGFTACLFIYTDFIGASTNSMTWDQLQEMKGNGFEIGSHSLSHCDLTKRWQGEDEEHYNGRIRKELLQSKQIIDAKLNQNTKYFAFPYGAYDHRVLSLCEEAGYTLGLSVNRGGNPFFSDPLALRRDQIMGKDMESFVQSLDTFRELPLR